MDYNLHCTYISRVRVIGSPYVSPHPHEPHSDTAPIKTHSTTAEPQSWPGNRGAAAVTGTLCREPSLAD